MTPRETTSEQPELSGFDSISLQYLAKRTHSLTTTTFPSSTRDYPYPTCTVSSRGLDWQYYSFKEGNGLGGLPYVSKDIEEWATNKLNISFSFNRQVATEVGRTLRLGAKEKCVGKWPIYRPNEESAGSAFIGLDHTGYFNPKVLGTYEFSFAADTAMYFWIGRAAYDGYSNSNFEALAYPGADSVFRFDVQETDLTIPIRLLFVGVRPCSSFQVTVRDPNGKTVMSSDLELQDDTFTSGCEFPKLPKADADMQPPKSPGHKCAAGLDWAFFALKDGSGPGRLPEASPQSDNLRRLRHWSSLIDLKLAVFGQKYIGGTTRRSTVKRASASDPIFGVVPDANPGYHLLQQVGYFKKTWAGNVTLALKGSGAAYVWLGNQARWDYRADNADAVSWAAQEVKASWNDANHELWVPIRVLAVSDGGKGFGMSLSVWDDQGVQLMGEDREMDDVFQNCDLNELPLPVA